MTGYSTSALRRPLDVVNDQNVNCTVLRLLRLSMHAKFEAVLQQPLQQNATSLRCRIDSHFRRHIKTLVASARSRPGAFPSGDTATP
jgi:hypothetical protein